jgi:anti-sigma B factor antagonist
VRSVVRSHTPPDEDPREVGLQIMEIRERSLGPVLILDVIGRMVLEEGENDRQLRDKVIERIAAGDRRIVVNLSQVSQIDTTGLTALVAAHLAAARRDARLGLANLTNRIHMLLGVTRLNTLFHVFETEEDAIAAGVAGSGTAT